MNIIIRRELEKDYIEVKEMIKKIIWNSRAYR